MNTAVVFHYLSARTQYKLDSKNYTFQKSRFQYHKKESSMKMLPVRLKKRFYMEPCDFVSGFWRVVPENNV